MKRLTFATGVALCAVTLVSGAALARSGAGDGRINFEQLDADGNGEITREEMMELRSRHIADMDANGDGNISLDELQAHTAEKASARAEKMMAQLDANEDGVLTADEMNGGKRAQKRFDRVDQDGDGVITEDEFNAARDRMAKRRSAKD